MNRNYFLLIITILFLSTTPTSALVSQDYDDSIFDELGYEINNRSGNMISEITENAAYTGTGGMHLSSTPSDIGADNIFFYPNILFSEGRYIAFSIFLVEKSPVVRVIISDIRGRSLSIDFYRDFWDSWQGDPNNAIYNVGDLNYQTGIWMRVNVNLEDIIQNALQESNSMLSDFKPQMIVSIEWYHDTANSHNGPIESCFDDLKLDSNPIEDPLFDGKYCTSATKESNIESYDGSDGNSVNGSTVNLGVSFPKIIIITSTSIILLSQFPRKSKKAI